MELSPHLQQGAGTAWLHLRDNDPFNSVARSFFDLDHFPVEGRGQETLLVSVTNVQYYWEDHLRL
jgi:hypothetical protein